MKLAVADAMLDLLLPRVCVACDALCGSTDDLVCDACWVRLPRFAHPQCDRCGHPTGAYACPFCPLLPPFVRAVRSVCWLPHPTSSAIVHALKYAGWERVAEGIATRLARLTWPADVVAERTAIVPIPLARVRERERGFNQSERIARALAPRWRVPVWPDILARTRATATQTRLTPSERSANVHRVFAVAPDARERLRGAHVVLLDDVITTAATMNAAATALFEGGVRTVSYVTFGRART
jgi:ComF family protein